MKFQKRCLAVFLGFLLFAGILPAAGVTNPVVSRAEAFTSMADREKAMQNKLVALMLAQLAYGYNEAKSGEEYRGIGNRLDCTGLIAYAFVKLGYGRSFSTDREVWNGGGDNGWGWDSMGRRSSSWQNFAWLTDGGNTGFYDCIADGQKVYLLPDRETDPVLTFVVHKKKGGNLVQDAAAPDSYEEWTKPGTVLIKEGEGLRLHATTVIGYYPLSKLQLLNPEITEDTLLTDWKDTLGVYDNYSLPTNREKYRTIQDAVIEDIVARYGPYMDGSEKMRGMTAEKLRAKLKQVHAATANSNPGYSMDGVRAPVFLEQGGGGPWPVMWDARQRGSYNWSGKSIYAPVWQVDSLNPYLGVTVNNSTIHKTTMRGIVFALEPTPTYTYADMEINKTAAGTGEPLSGASFVLYEWSESAGTYKKSLSYAIKEIKETGRYGIFKGNKRAKVLLTSDNAGKFRIIEKKAPPGYSNIDPETGQPFAWDASFEDDGTDTQKQMIDAVNTPLLGRLTIRKTVSGGPAAEGTYWFLVTGPAAGSNAVSGSADRWVSVTITDNKERTEEVTLEDLPTGIYRITEVSGEGSFQAPEISDEFPWLMKGDGDVLIEADLTALSEWVNEYRKGALTLTKKDAEGPLEGIVFRVFDDKDCASELETLVTAADGTATSREYLIPEDGRKVYVKEIRTDNRHVLDDTVYEAELLPDETVRLNGGEPIVNERVMGRIGIKKTGLVYVGYTEAETEFGPVKTPRYEKRLLQGAKFYVFRAEDVTVRGEDVSYRATDAVATLISGTAEVFTDPLPLGRYVVVEDEAPPGYIKKSYVGTVNLKKDETVKLVVKHLNHENRPVDTRIGVYKEAEVLQTTEEGERVSVTARLQPGEGFVFGVFAAQTFAGAEGTIAEGDLVSVGTTDADGRIEFSDRLPFGKYIVKELKTRDGYEAVEEAFPIELSLPESGSEPVIRVTALPDEGAIVNHLKKKEVKISKKSLLNDEPLPGTRIRIYDEDGTLLFDQLTDKDGDTPVFYALYGHSYTFREQYAPSGYAVFSETLSFRIDEKGNIIGATEIKDDITRIRLVKMTEDGQLLPGTEFTLFDSEEQPVQVVLSNDEGVVEFTDIPYGDYIIRETRPATGMQLSDFQLAVHVDGNWVNPDPVEVTNHPDERTGEDSFLPFGLLILTLLILCTTIVLHERRQKAQSEASLERALS